MQFGNKSSIFSFSCQFFISLWHETIAASLVVFHGAGGTVRHRWVGRKVPLLHRRPWTDCQFRRRFIVVWALCGTSPRPSRGAHYRFDASRHAIQRQMLLRRLWRTDPIFRRLRFFIRKTHRVSTPTVCRYPFRPSNPGLCDTAGFSAFHPKKNPKFQFWPRNAGILFFP